MLKEPLIAITIIIIIIIIIIIFIIIIIIITSTTVSTRAVFKWMTKAITPFATATLSDCQLCNHREANAKPIAPCTRIFSRALSKLQATDRNSDWFIAPVAPVDIDLSNYFAIGFSTVIWKQLYCYCY